MKVEKITDLQLARIHPRSPARKCPACGRQIRAGQHVLTHRLTADRYADATMRIHVACLRERIEDVPEDDIAPSNADAALAQARREAKQAALAQR